MRQVAELARDSSERAEQALRKMMMETIATINKQRNVVPSQIWLSRYEFRSTTGTLCGCRAKFYVCTENPNINVLRIAQRYLNGGHEVPISKIFSRYYKSLTFAAQAIRFVDRAYVYDNSRENELPQLLYRTSEGSVFKRYSYNIPLLADSLIWQYLSHSCLSENLLPYD